MVFIHPTGPVLTHFFGSVLTHPTGGIDIRTCIQADSSGNRKKECTRYVHSIILEPTIGPVHTHTHTQTNTQNLKPSASLFRGDGEDIWRGYPVTHTHTRTRTHKHTHTYISM